jgi:hypothetical protein
MALTCVFCVITYFRLGANRGQPDLRDFLLLQRTHGAEHAEKALEIVKWSFRINIMSLLKP